MGRESSEEFNEDLAPSEADRITMSGCLMAIWPSRSVQRTAGRTVD